MRRERERSDAQRDIAEGQADAIGARIGAELGETPSPSGALPDGALGIAEERLGVPLDGVRTRADSGAQAFARREQALAVTQGSTISLGEEFSALDGDGRRALLGHELTHVAQQRSAGTSAVQRQAKPTSGSKGPQVPPGTAGSLKTPGFTAWRFVVYADHVKLAHPGKEIGTIPWITNNPGNLMVRTAPHPKGRAHESELEVHGFAGVYGKSGRYFDPSKVLSATGKDQITRKYATFETAEAGEMAIGEWLRKFGDIRQRAGAQAPTFETAARAFVGENPDVYIRNVRAGLKRADVSESDIARLMAKPVTQITPGEWALLQQGIKFAEGSKKRPGVIYGGAGSFSSPNFNDQPDLAAEVYRLTSSTEVEAELAALFR